METKSTLFETCKQITAKEAAGKAGIDLDQRGDKSWGHCFLHEDNHPSLAFYDDGGFYCFSCKAGGDSVKLYELLYGLPPADAAKRLLTDFGLASDDIATGKPVKRFTGRDLKNATETVRERRIDELLTIKRKALKRIDTIEQKADLSEDDRLRVMQLQAAASNADFMITMLESYSPSDLTVWVAGGASINGI